MTTQPADWADAASENVPYVARRTEPDAPVPARVVRGLVTVLAVALVAAVLLPAISWVAWEAAEWVSGWWS